MIFFFMIVLPFDSLSIIVFIVYIHFAFPLKLFVWNTGTCKVRTCNSCSMTMHE